MFDANDIKVLREMFGEQDKKIEKRFNLIEKRLDNLDERVDSVREEILVKMEKGFSQLRDDIIDVIEDNIQPQLNSHNARIIRLERLQSRV
ncbi:MAG: hypothetical protein WCT28_03600 [Patescibacteria group bacterium]|jgi:hypothetical protein